MTSNYLWKVALYDVPLLSTVDGCKNFELGVKSNGNTCESVEATTVMNKGRVHIVRRDTHY